MTNIFEPVTLTWKNVEYVIPPNRVLRAIAIIEDVIPMQELIANGEKGTAPIAKIACAFGAVLRYAGAKVTDDEVYAGMFVDAGSSAIPAAINNLMMMMIPRNVFPTKSEQAALGKSSAVAIGKNSSKARSKQSSVLPGLPPSSSGH